MACSVAGCGQKWKNTKGFQTVSFASLRLIEKNLLEGISFFPSLFLPSGFQRGNLNVVQKEKLLVL